MGNYKKISEFFQQQFNQKIYKINLDALFTCPNIDGKRGFGGCTFCNNQAFSPATWYRNLSITEQINQGIASFKKRKLKPPYGFLAYFQAYSNTYAPVEVLEKKYYEALNHPEILGLSIATRPDCLDDDVLELLSQIAKKTHLWLEIGVESTHNQTLIEVNRGHLIEEFLERFEKVKAIESLYTCIHLIHGLPGEDESMMLDSVKKISSLRPNGIKFHQLEIVKETPLATAYLKGEISLLSREQYLEILTQSIRYLHPDIWIHRLFGFSHPSLLLAPTFEKPFNYTQWIEDYLKQNHLFQGDLCE